MVGPNAPGAMGNGVDVGKAVLSNPLLIGFPNASNAVPGVGKAELPNASNANGVPVGKGVPVGNGVLIPNWPGNWPGKGVPVGKAVLNAPLILMGLPSMSQGKGLTCPGYDGTRVRCSWVWDCV